MTNKYLEKIAAQYNVVVPHTDVSDWLDTDSLSLNKKEYNEFKDDTNKHWSGKSMANHAAFGAAPAALIGGLASKALGAKGIPIGGIATGALLGAVMGLNRSREFAKARALHKHFPELDLPENKYLKDKHWYE